jgi:hypothetical protein
MKFSCSAIMFACLVASVVQGQSSVDREGAKLTIDDYKNLEVMVFIPDNFPALTKDAVTTRTELRRRAAGLRPAKRETFSRPFLAVTVDVTTAGPAFHTRVDFMRRATWTLPDGKTTSDIASVWSSSTVGAGNASYVLEALDDNLHKFLNEYLKANQK